MAYEQIDCVELFTAKKICTGFNLLTPIFLLPYIIMDFPICDS